MKDDFDYDDGDLQEPGDDDSGEQDFDKDFEELGEDDDLSLGGAFDQGVTGTAPVEPPTPPVPDKPVPDKPVPPAEKKGLKPLFIILPVLGILIGVFFLKPWDKPNRLSGLESRKPPPSMAPFVRPKIDNTIPDDYVRLKTIEIRDRGKIASLLGRGLLKKNEQGMHRKIAGLTLVLYRTEVRYVVSQTYHYADGTEWKVKTQFSGPENEPGEVIKDFAEVYAG